MSARGDLKLKFPAGGYEDHVVTLVIATQFAVGAMAILTFAFWLLVAPTSDGNWYLSILALSLFAGLLAYLLSHLFQKE